jgi:CheY-like chemotaxis protein
MIKPIVLLIDDDPMSNVFGSIIIKKHYPEMEVLTMNSGLEAIAYLKENAKPKPEIIFLDLNMPVMNGWEFLDEYKKMGMGINVILLTSSSSLEDIIKSQEYTEIKQYLLKPITTDSLKKVMTLLENKL